MAGTRGDTKMTEKKYDVTALGELLIDFTENGSSSQGNVLMEANPGGAPCNVLAMLAKLGRQHLSVKWDRTGLAGCCVRLLSPWGLMPGD